MPFRSAALALLLALPLATATAQAATLGIDVEGVETPTGKVEVSLFTSAEDFMKRPYLQQTQLVEGRAGLRFEFAGLPPGEYGVVVVHDENGNDVYDAGFFGIGAEGLGYSNDAGPLLGRPSFEAIRFEIGEEDIDIAIDLK